jgi:hypothetical protein
VKENGVYDFYVGDEKKFSCPNIGIIVTCSKVIKHGPAPQINAELAKMREAGQLVSSVESEEWDLKDLNKKIANASY